MLEVKNLSVSFDKTPILSDISFTVPEGSWLMIAGPNGAGKSTLAKAIAQSVLYRGQIMIDGRDIRSLKSSELALKLGMLEQNNYVGYAFTVEEIVRLGRYSYRSTPFSASHGGDDDAVAKALEYTGLSALAERSALTLSGGELQRVFLAQLMAQDPDILILDEPTNHLDLVYQKQIMELVKNWISGTGRSVVSVVHDLSLARAYGSEAMLLSDGKIVSYGDVHSVFSDKNLSEIYGMDVKAWMQQLLLQWT